MSVRDQLKEIERLRTEGILTTARYHEQRSLIVDELLRSRWFSWRASFVGFGVGCIALITIPVILIAVVAIAFVSSDPDEDGLFGDRPDVHLSLANGSTGLIESSNETENRVTIVSIVDPVSGNDASPPAGYRFVQIEARVERIAGPGGDQLAIGGDFASSFQLRTNAVTGDDATAIARSDVRAKSAESIDVLLTFEVPIDTDVEWLRFNPNSFVGSIYFDND